jgi:hypothetical protein
MKSRRLSTMQAWTSIAQGVWPASSVQQLAASPTIAESVTALSQALTTPQLVDAQTSASMTTSTAPTESAGTAVSNTELAMETPGERVMFAVLDRDGRVYGAAKSAATLFKNEGAARNKARNDGDTVIRVRLDLRAEPVFIRKKVL